MGYAIFAILIIIGALATFSSSLGISLLGLIGVIVVILCIAAIWFFLFSKTCGEDEVEENGKKVTKKLTFRDRLKEYGIVIAIAVGILLFVGILLLCGGLGSSSGSSSGRYGRGEEYDEQIYSLADEYGADPDDVNDVYEYWENEVG